MNLEIYVSNRCNFGCHYCCVTTNSGPSARISAQKAIRGIDQFLASTADGGGASGNQIYFLGGEPMLDFPVIRAAVQHLRAVHKTIGARVYTNGSLLTPANVAFLHEHAVQIWISLDGAEKTNDRHRTVYGKPGNSAYQAVISRLKDLDTGKLALNVVVHPDTAATLVADLKEFAALGIGRVNIQPELYARWTSAQLRGLYLALSNLRRYYSAFIRRHRRLPFVIPILFSVLDDFSRLGENITPWWNDCQNVVLGSDGRYYLCERLLSSEYRELDEYAIGDVEVGLDVEKKEKWMEEARRYLYARGEKSREHYHCPKGDYLYSRMKGEEPGAMLDNTFGVSRAFCRSFLALARDLEHEPIFRSVYIEKKKGGAADEGRPERLRYS